MRASAMSLPHPFLELAKALDVPVAYLFAEDDDLAAAILAFAKLPSAERQRMREELERLAGEQRD